ncbi:putative ATP-dependent endonuclease of OLD family [Thermodesulfitimonas autotrophica]|uniref:Putative ATP-dependent endonuclease of OLD family n=1 Tax=Thermodesulfitimonas autotrophica TaxID=1894989 RepID=A0A3N5BZT2_9THEO|nr:AAA family ATPase [Thermodesulfitimonas autotrophica]RPF49391.1 putative ATP-dependent endonuclease of OLD family [Thermodesulfitimonas autotrophica]
MRLCNLRIKNYRSIVDSGDIRIEPFQIFVGENNAGKSNILKAIDVFLAPGAGGVQESNFFDKSQPIVITCMFTGLTPEERRALRPYLLGDKLILEKHLVAQTEEKTGKVKVVAEYHGYVAKPKDWWLSVEGVIAEKGDKPNWRQVAEENGILEYVSRDGKVTKASYEAGLRRLLQERDDVEYEDPTPGNSQALGLQPVLLSHLPGFYLLPAITDYSNEIDRRSSSTVFRRLMGDLADRIIKTDPRYSEIELSLQRIKNLLNPPESGEDRPEDLKRLDVLSKIEETLQKTIVRLMPSVNSVCLKVMMEGTRDLFLQGVSLKVDDGVLTDVLEKGHGLQRSVVFGLLQTLIMNQRGQLLPLGEGETESFRPIILAIEEPELYIHPQMQRLVFGVLREFSESDQVIYTTHSPAFVDVADYHCIGVTRKDTVEAGTHVYQCDPGVLGSPEEKKGFQFLNSFGLEQNQLFFAKKVILVEGEQDSIAIMSAGRKLGLFKEFPEEIGYTIIIAGNKQEIPKFQKLLNAFQLPYIVWLELDGKSEEDDENIRIINLLNGNRCVKLPQRLEDLVDHSGHFGSTYHAKKYFENPDNITNELEKRVKELFQ